MNLRMGSSLEQQEFQGGKEMTDTQRPLEVEATCSIVAPKPRALLLPWKLGLAQSFQAPIGSSLFMECALPVLKLGVLAGDQVPWLLVWVSSWLHRTSCSCPSLGSRARGRSQLSGVPAQEDTHPITEATPRILAKSHDLRKTVSPVPSPQGLGVQHMHLV